MEYSRNKDRILKYSSNSYEISLNIFGSISGIFIKYFYRIDGKYSTIGTFKYLKNLEKTSFRNISEYSNYYILINIIIKYSGYVVEILLHD